MSDRTLDFTDHRRELGENRYVYPVISRRSAGLSIGINLNPDKVCNFDCPYCQVDRTTPPTVTEVDLTRLAAELDALLERAAGGALWQTPPFDTAAPHLRRVNDVAFAGDGEPTAYRGFAEAVEIAGTLLERWGLSRVQPVVLTNATLLHRPRVAAGLERLYALGGELWAKLDAGTEPYFQLVDGTTLPFDRVLRNIRDAAVRHPLVIQAMFLRYDGQGPSAAERDAWAERLREIRDAGGKIRLVQVYSVARRPADARIAHLPEPELEDIAARVRALSIPAAVYPGR